MTPHCVRLTPYTHSTHTLCRLHLAMSTTPVHVGCQNFLSIPLHDNTLRTSDTLHTLDTYSLPFTSCDVDSTCACRMSEFLIYSTTWHHIAYVWHPTHTRHILFAVYILWCRQHLCMQDVRISYLFHYMTSHFVFLWHPTHTRHILLFAVYTLWCRQHPCMQDVRISYLFHYMTPHFVCPTPHTHSRHTLCRVQLRGVWLVQTPARGVEAPWY